MKLKVACQGCGNSLEADTSIRHATCNACHASLEIVQGPSITHTRVVAECSEESPGLSEELRVLRLQNELRKIDSSWARYRDQSLMGRRFGRVSEPSAGDSVFGGVAVMVLGVVILVSLPGVWAAAGLIGIAVGVGGLVSGRRNAKVFEDRRSQYKAQRENLLREIGGDSQG